MYSQQEQTHHDEKEMWTLAAFASSNHESTETSFTTSSPLGDIGMDSSHNRVERTPYIYRKQLKLHESLLSNSTLPNQRSLNRTLNSIIHVPIPLLQECDDSEIHSITDRIPSAMPYQVCRDTEVVVSLYKSTWTNDNDPNITKAVKRIIYTIPQQHQNTEPIKLDFFYHDDDQYTDGRYEEHKDGGDHMIPFYFFTRIPIYVTLGLVILLYQYSLNHSYVPHRHLRDFCFEFLIKITRWIQVISHNDQSNSVERCLEDHHYHEDLSVSSYCLPLTQRTSCQSGHEARLESFSTEEHPWKRVIRTNDSDENDQLEGHHLPNLIRKRWNRIIISDFTDDEKEDENEHSIRTRDLLFERGQMMEFTELPRQEGENAKLTSPHKASSEVSSMFVDIDGTLMPMNPSNVLASQVRQHNMLTEQYQPFLEKPQGVESPNETLNKAKCPSRVKWSDDISYSGEKEKYDTDELSHASEDSSDDGDYESNMNGTPQMNTDLEYNTGSIPQSVPKLFTSFVYDVRRAQKDETDEKILKEDTASLDSDPSKALNKETLPNNAIDGDAYHESPSDNMNESCMSRSEKESIKISPIKEIKTFEPLPTPRKHEPSAEFLSVSKEFSAPVWVHDTMESVDSTSKPEKRVSKKENDRGCKSSQTTSAATQSKPSHPSKRRRKDDDHAIQHRTRKRSRSSIDIPTSIHILLGEPIITQEWNTETLPSSKSRKRKVETQSSSESSMSSSNISRAY